ncbi:MAG: hypothetical protein H7066_14815 [Cytophagaceae bacterium]|nr:hypothetical protein [Gemmatimonadaceae bacterium]
MEDGILNWLASVGSTAFRWSALGFLVVNAVAVTAVVLTKDRGLVNRWTGRLVGANLALAATGLGIPLLTTVTRVAVAAVMPSTTRAMPVKESKGALRSEVLVSPLQRNND